jgi:hypothetical protein
VDIGAYLDEVRAAYASGHATEHSYRPRSTPCSEHRSGRSPSSTSPRSPKPACPTSCSSAATFPFGWAEAKDIDKDVIKLKGYSVEQRKRYESAYPNLIYTNGVDFEFIREGESRPLRLDRRFPDGPAAQP